MKIMLLGSPGAGKGTVAKELVKHDGSVHISTGDILRGEIKAGSELGKKAKSFMDSGGLVPDSLIMDMMEKRLQEPDCKKGFIFDGFPRTIPQAEELDKMFNKLGIKFDLVANIDVSKDVVLDRLTTRRTCSNSACQAIYNVKSMPTKVAGICDKCGSQTVQRADETEEAITKRLETYIDQTAPLIDYYSKKGMLKNIKSTDSKEVISQIISAL
ncbi:MAG: adenylate kinase [Nitrospirae bacterium]|nr:adenylate kinase [Nitrospirota bacterium]